MKKWGKIILYSIVVLLSLEVIKTLVSRSRHDDGYMIAVIISCIQVLYCLFVVTAAFLYPLLNRRVRYPWVGVSVFFILLIALTEGYFLYMLQHPRSIPGFLKKSYAFYYDFFQRSIIQFEADNVSYNNKLTYTLKPSAAFDFNDIEFKTHFRTNKLGVRDDEKSLEAPAIIFVGDSYTMGWGVEEKHAFPSLIEQKTGLPALNAGVASYGTVRELSMLQMVSQQNLRCLVIQYCANDIVENISYLNNQYQLPITPEAKFKEMLYTYEQSRIYFPAKVFLLISQYYVKSLINRLVYIFPLPTERPVGVADEQQHARNFAEVLLHCPIDFNKVKLIVTRLNELGFMERNFISELKKIAATSPYYEKFGKHFTALDLQPILTKDDYYILDVHLNQNGHRKVADAILSVLPTH